MGMKRLLTAAVVLPLIILYVMKLPPVFYAGLMAFIAAIAQSEFYTMYRVRGALLYAGLIGGSLILTSIYLSGDITGVMTALFIVVVSLRLFTVKDPSRSLSETAPVVFGLVYIPLLLGYQIFIREQGPEWIIFLYASVWCADASAYYIGKGFGKRKLYESMSPKKTVAGGVASVFGGAAGALLFLWILSLEIPAPLAAASGALTGIVTVVGDLSESMFKRDAGVKDSGAIVPGHGGVLDKIDGVVFAGPAMYWLFTMTGMFY